MKPTVGRLVYYKSYGTPKGEYKPEDRAAIVTAVHDDETLDLCVFNPTGLFFNQKVKKGSEGGQWDWMQEEKDQMAKEAAKNPNLAKDIIKEVMKSGVASNSSNMYNGGSSSNSR